MHWTNDETFQDVNHILTTQSELSYSNSRLSLELEESSPSCIKLSNSCNNSTNWIAGTGKCTLKYSWSTSRASSLPRAASSTTRSRAYTNDNKSWSWPREDNMSEIQRLQGYNRKTGNLKGYFEIAIMNRYELGQAWRDSLAHASAQNAWRTGFNMCV